MQQAPAHCAARCAVTALLCVLAGFAWQALTVRYNYGGNWTGLFVIGSFHSVPPLLEGENLYIFPESGGYDGQSYHMVAHDPLLRAGLGPFIDDPVLRYRRILLPAAAFLLALGRFHAIDASYIAVNLLFLFAGTWWLSRYLAVLGRPPACAFLFLLVPSTVTSLDRLTIDLAATSLCMGFAYHVEIESRWRLFAVLVLACLSRETCLLLPAAFCSSLLARRQFRRAALFALAPCPALLWYAFVGLRTSHAATAWSQLVPFAGFWQALAQPVAYPFGSLMNGVIVAHDLAATIGMLAAIVLAWIAWSLNPLAPVPIAAILWALAALPLPAAFWQDCCSAGRVFSPLLILLALREPALPWAAPLLLVSARNWLQMAPAGLSILRGLFGFD